MGYDRDVLVDEYELNGAGSRSLLKGSEDPEDVARWLGKFSRSAQYSSARKGLPEVLQTIAASVDQTGVAWDEVSDMLHSAEWMGVAAQLQGQAAAGAGGAEAQEDGEARRSIGEMCAKLYGIFDRRMRMRFVTRRIKADASKLLIMKMEPTEQPQDYAARMRKEVARVAPQCQVHDLAKHLVDALARADVKRLVRVYTEQEATSKLEALHDVLSGAETLGTLAEDDDEDKQAVAKRVADMQKKIVDRRAVEAANAEAFPEALRTPVRSQTQTVLTVVIDIILGKAQSVHVQLAKQARDAQRTPQDAPQLLQALEKLAVPRFASKAWCESPCDLHPHARVPHRCGNCAVYSKVDKLKGGSGKPRHDGAYAAMDDDAEAEASDDERRPAAGCKCYPRQG